jgi:chromate transporter
MQPRLAEIALLFLKLGTIGFGGPAAHIALMEAEVVRRRRWLSHEEFLDLVGATNLIPGPNSTEMAIHVGYRKAGFAGLIVAGLCFILPAAVIVAIIAWAYVRYGTLPQLDIVLKSVKPVDARACKDRDQDTGTRSDCDGKRDTERSRSA